RCGVASAAETFPVVRGCVDAFNQEDVEKWVEFFHPDVKFIPMCSYWTPRGTTYNGRVGMRTWFDAVFAQRDRIRPGLPQSPRNLGDRVLVGFAVFNDRDPGPVTGAAILAFTDGKISRVESFPTETEALAAHDQQNQQLPALLEHAS